MSDQSPISYKSAKLQKASEGSYRDAAPAYNMTRKPQRTIRPKPAWCKPCKKTQRGVKTPEGFRCRACAEAMGFNVKGRKGQGGAGRFASPMENLFGIGRSGADARAAQLNADASKMKRRAAGKKAAATRRRKAAIAARKAMFDGMMRMNSITARFIPMNASSAVCRGCKGRADPRRVEWLSRDFKACVCSECAEKVSA